MRNKNLTFQQFIERLKTIDVGELLEKAKSINVEDIRSIKLSDLKEITKSNYFYPSIGILFASLSSILFFFPSIESLKNTQEKSSQYKSENIELPLIIEKLKERSKSIISFRKLYSEFVSLVPKKEDLVLIPEILFESALKSNTEIIEFSPISKDELSSCTTKSEEELFNTEFISNKEFNNNNLNNFESQISPINNNYSYDYGNIESGSKKKVYKFNLDEKDGTLEFNSLTKKVSDIFQSNYYLINIKSNYLNSLNFIKYIQEYKIFILPYCFEPRMAGESSNNISDINSPSIEGEIDARIIVNIPYYKEK
ncbi:hypothetical protein CU313_05580 [Prochlorococcus marinus str. MU1404]|uniref:hypothetical protein n=1 Tax=Prochlorococcus marinus TaxID=1219 RepID=UPI001ADB57D6|nr:hypothetical protein [Prochlorococcus marinus]MBO8229877.1 hypothetical protein [Prochlorococcus marinus XMU1404]MBW3073338.1 hypothetical protein [Prochlorococcus marinus str. MU1404]MCR8545787.1 hypothetical protein [Prochlorococcus marinus CUG1432]